LRQIAINIAINNVLHFMNIAIIGSGIAAATLTAYLRRARPDVALQIFEKSRGVGGRMSTRRREPWAFDHGVPFFTARTKSFQQMLKAFQSEGVIDEWHPKVITMAKGKKPYNRDWFEPHYVSLPTMNQLCKALLDEQPVRFQQTINKIEGEPGAWTLDTAEGENFGPFNLVVSTAPAEQTQVIFQNVAESPRVDFEPCFTLMVKGPVGYQPRFDAAKINDGNIKWLTWCDRKPGRSSHPSLVAHATGQYSRTHFDADRDSVKEALALELNVLLPDIFSGPIPVESTDIHRWKYATVIEPLGDPFWMDPSGSLAACGDWFLGNEVEHAFTSASTLAKHISEGL
jgi:renalase